MHMPIHMVPLQLTREDVMQLPTPYSGCDIQQICKRVVLACEVPIGVSIVPQALGSCSCAWLTSVSDRTHDQRSTCCR